MSSPQYTKWLETASGDEEEQSGYDSEVAERQDNLKGMKRTRQSGNVESDGLESETDGEESKDISTLSDDFSHAHDSGLSHGRAHKRHKIEPRRIKTPEPEIHQLSRASRSRSSATGVLYLSRVPPFMKPQTLKHLLEPYGEIGRIFLTPEDPASHSKRVKSGGNKKRSFTDGWVEFLHKRHAKVVAETLNAQTIGGKKGGWYHDDVWNLKYLKGFKWHHLTEQIANENAERAARLRAEISQTSVENKRFAANVEHGKMLEAMQTRQKHQAIPSPNNEAGSKNSLKSVKKESDSLSATENVFKQKRLRRKTSDSEQDVQILDVLQSIF